MEVEKRRGSERGEEDQHNESPSYQSPEEEEERREDMIGEAVRAPLYIGLLEQFCADERQELLAAPRRGSRASAQEEILNGSLGPLPPPGSIYVQLSFHTGERVKSSVPFLKPKFRVTDERFLEFHSRDELVDFFANAVVHNSLGFDHEFPDTITRAWLESYLSLVNFDGDHICSRNLG